MYARIQGKGEREKGAATSVVVELMRSLPLGWIVVCGSDPITYDCTRCEQILVT